MKSSTYEIPSTNVRVHTVESGLSGPSVVVTANLHGDETTGIAVIHRLMKSAPDLLQCGSLYLYPTLNPDGLRLHTRVFPHGKSDLNRGFPGRKIGSRMQRFLWAIWGDICTHQPDCLIDLHTDSGASIPYTLVDRVIKGKNAAELERRSFELAQKGGLFTLWEYPRTEYARLKLDRSLAGMAVNQLRIPALTVEVGPRRRIDPTSVDITYGAVLRWLHALGVTSMSPAPFGDCPSSKCVWRREIGPRACKAGLFLPQAPLGKPLPKGTCLGLLVSPNGDFLQEIRTSRESMVISFPDEGYLNTGEICATLAVREQR